MDKIEIILTNCIKDIKSGRVTLAECLTRYPSQRQKLEPLLKLALNIQEPPAFLIDNSYRQAAKSRLLEQIRASKQKRSLSFADIFSFGIPPQSAWARVVVSVLVVVVLLSTLTAGTAYAAQNSLPGDLLYPVKAVTEDVRLLIAGGSAAKAKLNLKFAQIRLVEMNELATHDQGNTELAVDGYRGNINSAKQQIRGISDAAALSNLLEGALNDIQNQMFFCDEVIDTDPRYVDQVREASTLNINVQLELLELLAQRDNLRAAQVNLDTMRNRLQRAQEKANSHQYQMMEEVLLQYQQFNRLGERILQSAQSPSQHNTEIEALTFQTLTSCLNTLDNIYRQVPQEYRNGIETCRQMTLQFQNQARHRYQKQGNPDTSSEGQPSGNSDGSTTGQGGQTAPQNQGGTDNPNSGIPNTNTTPSQGTGGGSGASTGGDTSGNGGTDTGDSTDSGGRGGGE